MPVARGPFCARGPLFLFLSTAHVQQNCTVVQYKKKGRTPTNERTTNEIPFNIKGSLEEAEKETGKESDSCLHADGVTQLLGDGRLLFWVA